MQRPEHDRRLGPPDRNRAPLVSAVMAAHNAERHIAETCASVLGQTYPSIEVIIVDDGSTDDTGNIVRSLAESDPRIRLIRQQNLGAAEARNRAIAAATGDFVAPIDADDIWDPTKLERQVRRMEECGPETGLVYCWWAWIDVAGTVLACSPHWKVEGRVLQRLVEVNFAGSASVPLYRRVCVEAVGGYRVDLRDQGRQGCEDWDLALRIAERYSVANVPAVLVGYRRRADSMSGDRQGMWRSMGHVVGEIAARQPSISPSVLGQARAQFAMHLAGVAFWSGNYLQACAWALRARSLMLGLAVTPSVVRMLARRWLGITPSRSTLTGGTGLFAEAGLPEPAIPYDRIYARRWHREGHGDSISDGSAGPP